MSEPNNPVAVSPAHLPNYPAGIQKSIRTSGFMANFSFSDRFSRFAKSHHLQYGSQKLPSPIRNAQLCAPCEMGLQHVLHCTHPRSTMNCCPHQESPRNMAMAQGLKHLATNGSTEFVVFPMFLCTICMTPFNSIVANHINIVTQPFKIFGKMEVTIL